MELSLIEKAARIAVAAHEGQTRKSEAVPYITHPMVVSLRLAQEGFPEEVIAAALVHDVVEDSEVRIEEIREKLGDTVADIVAVVTQDDSLSWEEKKQKYADGLRTAPEGAKAVAVMDKIHNAEYTLASYAKEGPAVWDRFNRGKEKKIWFEEEVLSSLEDTWDHPLISYYRELIEKLKAAE